jgi:serine/threonine-protein kinase
MFLEVPVWAQSSDAATAELLFQQGRDLLRAGKAAEACPKLAESQRLDPATGTLLALAMCHEAEGKLASAWAEFVNVEARSRSEGRADREQVSKERAAALRPRLSTLEIRVAGETASLSGLEIRRDGVALGSGAWNTAVPVDGGKHVVEVTAPGRRAWKGEITLKTEGDVQVLAVPALEQAPVAPEPAEPSGSVALDTQSAGSKPWGTLEWAGVGTAGAGVIALGVGGFFLSSALGKNSDSEDDCNGNVCGDQGTKDRNDAISDGNTATWLGVAGGVLVAGGATLFIVGRSGSSEEKMSAGTAPRLAVGAGPRGFSAQLSTRF